MSYETLTRAEYPPSHLASKLEFPLLDKQPGRGGRQIADLGAGHPVWTYVAGILSSFAVIAAVSIALGLLVTTVLLHVHGVAAWDERLVDDLAHHRSSGLTHASLIGSIMGGGVVLPIIAGVAALIALIGKHWRLAGFLLFALAIESGSYRATTLVVHRPRPDVPRLESLPANASYPSGHTAASIAIYCGIALLLTSRIANRAARVAIWVVAVSIPLFVALSRVYRGMHHPIDVAGGVLIGVAVLGAVVLVSRVARSAEK